MSRSRMSVALAALLLAGLAACGKGEKVGEAFKGFEGEKSGDRIGEVENTPKPTTKPGEKPADTPPPAQKAQPTPQQAQALNVKITSSGFDPTAARIYKGSTVTVTNTDSAPHTYTASDGTYDSGSLSPGQSKSFSATVVGNFQIEDRTRNWIIGSLEVVAR